MSYVVLARKWRPQTFDDLVGQEHVARTLANSIALDRVAHAFLFTGVRGVGKTTSARILAKALNCEKGPTASPCLACPACLEIGAGSSMDVLEIDAATRNSVDDVRELQEKLAYRPARDRFKIFVVDEVHMLSTAAWNAFLKTLEEPPPHVKFIFATTEVGKVPVTVLSRCQRYDFKMIAASTIAARLRHVLGAESIAFEDGAVALLAREAAGSMRDAMSLLDQVIAHAGAEGLTTAGVARALGVAETVVLQRLADALLAGDAARSLEVVAELCDAGYDVGPIARDLLGLIRDLVVARVAPDARALLDVPDAELADLRALAARHAPDDLVRTHQALSRALDDVLRSPVPRASLEMALVRLARRPALVPIDELLRKLGELETRLATGAPRAAVAPARGGSGPVAGAFAGPAPAPRAAEAAERARPRPSEPSDDPEPGARPAPAFAQTEPERPTSLPSVPERPTFTPPESVRPGARPSAPPAAPKYGSTPPPIPLAAKVGSPIVDEVDPRWLRLAEIVEELRGASAVLASLVELAPLVDLSAAGVVLAVDPTGFAAQRLADPESRATILAAVRRVLGDGASLEIGALAPDASGSFTLARMVDAATRERRVELERRVREHPLVLAAVRAFDAEVRDLRLAADAESVSITATAAAIGRAQRESR